MAKRLWVEQIDLDGERHERGEFCWCRPDFDRQDGIYWHNLRFENGIAVNMVKCLKRDYGIIDGWRWYASWS